MSDTTRSFLGAGWKFPPQLDSRGRIALVEEEEDVEEAIRVILLTQKWERQMRPEFGSELHRLQFASNDAATAGLACRYVEEALLRWEPRLESVEVYVEPGCFGTPRLVLNIRYRLITDNAERNLVFPFYIIPGEE